MTAAIRRLVRYSSEPEQLAQQVAELARDVQTALGVSITKHVWEGPVSYGKGFRVDVGKGRPDEMRVVSVESLTDRTFLAPMGVIWSWIDGRVQIDESAMGFEISHIYRVTFLATRVGT